MKVNIAIIGAGNIGSRHLQALIKLKENCHIFLIDPSKRSLSIAHRRSKDPPDHVKITKSITMDCLPEHIDIAIISTNADVRATVIKNLLMHAHVTYVIFEKVVFQKLEDFEEIGNLLEVRDIQAWVNCPLRLMDFFKHLKSEIREARYLHYQMSGSRVGIGSNAIHHLDLFTFITQKDKPQLTIELLDDQLITSKRDGFIEFTGTLAGHNRQGQLFTFTSYAEQEQPFLLQLTSEKVRAICDFKAQKAYLSRGENNWKWNEVDFEVPLQSNLTHRIVEQLLHHNYCELPTFSESWELHKELLIKLSAKYFAVTGKEVVRCPIT